MVLYDGDMAFCLVGAVAQMVAHLHARFAPICAEVLNEVRRSFCFATFVDHAGCGKNSNVVQGSLFAVGRLPVLASGNTGLAQEEQDCEEQRLGAVTHARGGEAFVQKGSAPTVTYGTPVVATSIRDSAASGGIGSSHRHRWWFHQDQRRW